MRSLLSIPALSAALPDPAATAADALVVDLTGAGAQAGPDADADAARRRARDIVAAAGARLRVFVRIDGIASAAGAADLAAVLPARPFGIVLAGVSGMADIEHLGARLRVAEAQLGRSDGETRVVPVLGTPAAVLAVAAGEGVADRLSRRRIAAYAWEPPLPGPDALDPPTDVQRLARSLALLAAGRAGVPALDPLPPDGEAGAAFRRACELALREGAGGRLVRSEAQVAIVNAVFPAGGMSPKRDALPS